MQTKKAPFFTFLMITLMAMGTAQTAWGDWVARYDDPTAQDDNARAVAVDSEGNVIVTGESQGPKSKSAYVTVKYAPDGSEIWVNRYEGPGKGNHKACGIALDSAGNILVTGSSMGLRTRSDLLTLKYDRNGNTLWERRFNAAKNGGDMARSIAVDAEDSVYVAGLAGSRSILLIKYASYGQELWAREYKPRKSGVDLVPSMGIDADGNVYLVGTEKWTGWRYRILVLKYSGAGELVWKSPYAVVSGRDNSPKAMTVDAGGQVHVAGVQWRSEISVYFLLKYDPGGSLLWEANYQFERNHTNGASAIGLDDFGNIFVTGTSYRFHFTEDSMERRNFRTLTLKYGPGGDFLWGAPYAGGEETTNFLTPQLAVDAAGNVYVTKALGGNATSYDYVTLKYDPMGNQEWVRRYDGDGNGLDEPFAIAVDPDANVYVTGRSKGLGSFDFATVKYTQP